MNANFFSPTFGRPVIIETEDSEILFEEPYSNRHSHKVGSTIENLLQTLHRQLNAFFESEGMKQEDYLHLDQFAKMDLHLKRLKEKSDSPIVKNPDRETELLTEEQEAIKQAVLNYFAANDSKLCEELRAIIDYLSGNCRLDEINLTKKNARLYLTYLKIVDIALGEFNRGRKFKKSFPKSGFKMRSRILKLLSPLMTTNEAYTKTLDPRKFKDCFYLSENSHWIPERAARHGVIAAQQLLSMQKLSDKLECSEESLFAYRGNTAAGKSESIKTDLNSFGIKKVRGVFTPDIFKVILRCIKLSDKKSFLVNNQVHLEGKALYRSLMDSLKYKMTCRNLMIEGRLSTVEEFKDNVLNVARRHFGRICLKDNASPLLSTLFRVLLRDPFTHQCPPLNDIIKGHKESILYRRKLFEIVAKNFAIKEFKFFYRDENNRNVLVAEKSCRKFLVHYPELLEKSCTMPSDEEIDQVIRQPISRKQIARAISRGIIPEESEARLLQWECIPLGKSVEFHAMGISLAKALRKVQKDNDREEKYGDNLLESFDGSWLSDFPNLINHLKSDQLLTVRGEDQKGEGLHWQTNKFSWKLNPKFNPDARISDSPLGGFQARVGYFIIPPDQAETFIAKSLSTDILKELEIRTEEGDIVGYRLFVHPEAYAHYGKLHAQSIRFVQPKHSEFMGTPTSSYRSWLLRRISTEEKTTPFIAKMGVSSSPSDATKLLPRSEIQTSLNAQKFLDRIPKDTFNHGGKGSDLLFFPENFGLALKNIKDYPPRYAVGSGDPIDSGMIIREIPTELLNGCKFLSLSALMSVLRCKPEHYGLSCLTDSGHKADALPLIYEIIQTAIDKRLVRNSVGFIRKYFIEGYLDAIEELYMKEGISFAPHGQNLCFVLNPDNTPRGWAYRDFEAIQLLSKQDYLQTYSLFSRYHILIKLLNVLVLTDKRMPEPVGTPAQLGAPKGMPERTLEPYISKNIQHSPKIHSDSLAMICQLHISPQAYKSLLFEMDAAFLKRLDKYFDLKKARILLPDGSIPAAEAGSSGEAMMRKANVKLWEYRRDRTTRK